MANLGYLRSITQTQQPTVKSNVNQSTPDAHWGAREDYHGSIREAWGTWVQADGKSWSPHQEDQDCRA